MAPIKFEENIKEKLENRSIEPSVNAWQNLEQKLNAESKKRNKNKLWWLGIAASLIGFLIVVQQFVTLDDTNQVITPLVVESENENITNQIESLLIVEESQEIAQEQLKTTSVNMKLNTVSIYKNKAKNQKEKQYAPLHVAIVTKTKKIPNTLLIPEDNVTSLAANTTGSLKKKEIQITTSETSESEIEALLNTANKKMQLSDNNTVKSISVDSDALLEDVESEMPPSLRGQLFKVIAENFKTATTAVTTRNE